MTTPVAGQPQIYLGTENAPGNGKRLCFIQTHGRVPIHIVISKQDYETLLRDGATVIGHEDCGEPCACYQRGYEAPREPPGI